MTAETCEGGDVSLLLCLFLFGPRFLFSLADVSKAGNEGEDLTAF
jgi:hypothetical protein